MILKIVLYHVCQRYRTEPEREREDKELTYSLCNPLAEPKHPLFWPANRRGSPSRIEGLGSSIDGVKGKTSPCRFGQSPRFLPCLAWLGVAEERRRPLSILIRSVKIRIGLL